MRARTSIGRVAENEWTIAREFFVGLRGFVPFGFLFKHFNWLRLVLFAVIGSKPESNLKDSQADKRAGQGKS